MAHSTNDPGWLLEPLKRLHSEIRATVVAACESSGLNAMSAIVKEEEGDTIYAVDRVSETVLVDFFEREIASECPVVLIAEGLENGKLALPRGTDESSAHWRIIVDPIDGTRGLMYQKRSAWVLTGVAPNRGEETRLSDVRVAVQTEIPLVKQHLFDQLVAIRGRGVLATRVDRVGGGSAEFVPGPSR